MEAIDKTRKKIRELALGKHLHSIAPASAIAAELGEEFLFVLQNLPDYIELYEARYRDNFVNRL